MDDDELFLPEQDENETLEHLAETLRLANRFLLLLVQINSPSDRNRLMRELQERVPDKPLKEMFLGRLQTNLFRMLEVEELPAGVGAVCVYGMENWLSAGKAAQNSPFVLNLNITRNLFARILPCPLILWLPEYLMRAIQLGSPDFFSVASGIFIFASTNSYDKSSGSIAHLNTLTAIWGLSPEERDKHIADAEKMLADLRHMPETSSNARDKAGVLSLLGTLYYAQALYHKAEPLYIEALSIIRRIVSADHPDSAVHLSNSASLYRSQGQYDKAEPLYLEALSIRRKSLMADHPDIAQSLNNLAAFYMTEANFDKAEPLFLEAMQIVSKSLSEEHPYRQLTTKNLQNFYVAWEEHKRKSS